MVPFATPYIVDEGDCYSKCQYWDGETVFLMKLSSAVKLLFGKGQINIATSSEGG